MDLKFDNYARPSRKGHSFMGQAPPSDYYEWRVFLDAPPDVLRQVESVTYRLHETFPDPIRVVKDRAAKFALQSAGWGEFDIRMTVRFRDGKTVHTKYGLKLTKPWPAAQQ